ncbi:hypothetical protein L1049_003680 [Liquidambar formosana]|uniref:Uncharacterized protein n=1 Tax=Liquidambar formosana TaxID=63359 RepID=A0AAP0RM21_LIQFO
MDGAIIATVCEVALSVVIHWICSTLSMHSFLTCAFAPCAEAVLFPLVCSTLGTMLCYDLLSATRGVGFMWFLSFSWGSIGAVLDDAKSADLMYFAALIGIGSDDLNFEGSLLQL